MTINNRLKPAFKRIAITEYCRDKNLRYMLGGTTIENNKVVRSQYEKVVIVNYAFQKPTTFAASKWYRLHLDISSAKLQKQLYHILIRMFQISDTKFF